MDSEYINIEDFDTSSYFSSYKNKYIIFDNLSTKKEPIVNESKLIHNDIYVYVIVVVNGTLNITINSTELQIHSNEYLTIMPCTEFQIKNSRCLYFAYAQQAYLVNAIYKNIGVKRDYYTHCFTFHHHHFTPDQIDKFKTIYLRCKREHEKENNPMKEFAIRATILTYYSQILTLLEYNPEISHVKDTKKEQLFKNFLDLLDQYYLHNRSVNFYAKQLNITPKYLSSTTTSLSGMSASRIIYSYVVFQIKLELYMNNRSVKDISKSLNFQSQSFFGRYFKRVTGMSPREYINKYSIKLVETNA